MSWISIKDSDYKKLSEKQLLDKLYSDYKIAMTCYGGREEGRQVIIKPMFNIFNSITGKTSKEGEKYLSLRFKKEADKQRKKEQLRYKKAFQEARLGNSTGHVVILENDYLQEDDNQMVEFAEAIGPIKKIENFTHKMSVKKDNTHLESVLFSIVNAKAIVLQTVLMYEYQLIDMLNLLELMIVYKKKSILYIRIMGEPLHIKLRKFIRETEQKDGKRIALTNRINNIIQFHDVWNIKFFYHDKDMTKYNYLIKDINSEYGEGEE